MKRSPFRKTRQTVDMNVMDKALEDNPPRIVWEHDGKGIQRAVVVDDPHAEGPQWRREVARWEDDYYEPEEVKPPVCMDESLLAAARAEI
ncbi:MAG TPA: hypothetical protein VIP77_13855 [Jiangellaceae bacterium]